MDRVPDQPILSVSQGTHFVLPHSFLPGKTALMIPKTADGRVLFAIPRHGSTIVGTTGEAVEQASDEPRALGIEKKFLFDHIVRYFGRRPEAAEIQSVWSGQRPLVRQGKGKTSQLSRDHKVMVSESGQVTITGGKWTTYRRMGQDTIDHAAEVASLEKRPSTTIDMKLHGWLEPPVESAPAWEQVYGADLPNCRRCRKKTHLSINSFIRCLLISSAKLCGLHATRWLAQLRMCSRAGLTLSSSMHAQRLRRRRSWQRFSPKSCSEAMRGGKQIWRPSFLLRMVTSTKRTRS